MRRALTATVALAMVLLVACRSKKEATASTNEVHNAEAVSSATSASAESMQWLSRLSLDIDSFEMEIPANRFAVHGRTEHDTVVALQKVTEGAYQGKSTAGAAAFPKGTIDARQPRQGSVVLRARHASIGRSDKVERNSASCAQQADSTVAHRTMDKQQHTASDNVQVAKPPDLTWVPWAILAIVTVVFMWFIWHEYERIDRNDRNERDKNL